MLSELVLRVRHAIYRTLAEGGVPLSVTLADKLNLPLDDVRLAYTRLHEAHAIVLDPTTREVWMALPFSAVPTPHRVTSGERAWFANCAWDAFGIPLLLGVAARVDSRCGDCDAPIVYRVEGERLLEAHGVAHFAVPASQWWHDIGHT